MTQVISSGREARDAADASGIRQFESDELKVLVPRVYGQTQEAATKRGGAGQRWDDVRLFDKLEATVGAKEFQIAKQIYEWMRKEGAREIIFGTGKANGSVYPAFRPDGVSINPVYLSSDGKLWIQFGSLDNKPVFGSIEARRELMHKFNAIDNVKFTDADLERYPSIPLSTIASDPNGPKKVLSALSWMEKQIEQTRHEAIGNIG